MTDLFYELGRGDGALLVGSAEDLVRSFVLPTDSIFIGIPMPDAEFGSLGREPQQLFGPLSLPGLAEAANELHIQ
jgi:hypothetical protein